MKNRGLDLKLLAGSQLFLLLCIFLTQSRIAILIAVALFGYFLWLVWQNNSRRSYALLAATALFCLAVVSIVHFDRLNNLKYLGDSTRYRVELIQAAWPSTSSLAIAGQGVGSIEKNIRKNGIHMQSIGPDIHKGWSFESSHNYFVDIIVERGILTFLLLAALVGYVIKHGVASHDEQQKLLSSILILSLAFLFLNNINIQ